MTLEEIKEECAKDFGFKNYEDVEDWNSECMIIDKVAHRYAKSQTEKLEKHLDILHKLLEYIQNHEVNVNDNIDKLINNALDEISKL